MRLGGLSDPSVFWAISAFPRSPVTCLYPSTIVTKAPRRLPSSDEHSTTNQYGNARVARACRCRIDSCDFASQTGCITRYLTPRCRGCWRAAAVYHLDSRPIPIRLVRYTYSLPPITASTVILIGHSLVALTTNKELPIWESVM